MQGGSLVDEIEEKRRRAEIERGREHQRKVRARIIFAVVSVVVLVLGTIAAGLIIERLRIQSRIDDVQTQLAVATPDALEEAAVAMGKNLAAAPEDDATLGLLAFVRVHQFASGLIEAGEVESALAAADEASLAAGLFAGLEGDLDGARRSYEAGAETEPSSRVEQNDLAWLRAITALARPYERDEVVEALEEVQAALERDGAWIPNRRAAAALLYRTGDPDAALAIIEAGREVSPNHVGLAVDDALYHAASRKEVGGVIGVSQQLLQTPGITPNDATYARLARGIALVHSGGEDAESVLGEAWEALPPWDNHARDLMIDALLASGRSDLAKERLEEVSFGPVADGVYSAWVDAIEGNTPRALEALAELPQEHPRVAHLQALALVEQLRWGEAKQWLDYAAETKGPPRPDLDVAKARAQTAAGDPAGALATLETIADEHPQTHRLWTAIAEAHVALGQAADDEAEAAENADDKAKDERAKIDKELRKALSRALEREPAPAEASLISAKRLAARAIDKPEDAADALEAYEKAAEINAFVPRYEAELGMYLAELGRPHDAEEILREVADAKGLDPEAVLVLADIVSERALEKKSPVPEEVEGWLKRSAELRAPIDRQDLSWARYELAQATPEKVLAAQARAERVLEKAPRDIEARVLLAQALIERQEYTAARSTLERGIQRTLKRVDGPLYIMEAKVEWARGKKRPAASLAFKGWRKLIKQPASPKELLATAPFVSERWLDIKQTRGARTVGRELVARMPYSVEAWVLRGSLEFADGENKDGCDAADKALELDPEYHGAIALRGDCEVRRFDFDAARKTYKKAIAAAKGTPAQQGYQRKLKRL